jgi:SAM-dependent methyltransferase
MKPRLVGYVDWYQSHRVAGWAMDLESPRCVNVEVLCDGQPLAVVPCTGDRPDLLQHYPGATPNHGFVFDIPPFCRADGAPHTITVRFADTQRPLPSLVGEILTDPLGEVLLREQRAATYQRGLWQLDGVALADGWLSARGWWLPPRLLPGVTPTFYVNQMPFQVCELQKRSDIASLMDIEDAEAHFGFQCRTPLDSIPPANGAYQFRIGYDIFPGQNTEEQDFYYLANPFPLPEAVRRQRIGDASEDAFHVAGATAYMKMQQTLRQSFGKGYDDFPRILDWGCGCGRVLRHFVAWTKSEITGIEIDRDNLQWCVEHYPSAHFREGRLEPPLQIPADSFDLIFGISVFTHLTEEMQHQWLAELRRITKPGGVVLMTVVGDVSWFRNRFSLEQFKAWKTTGFIDVGSDAILDEHIGRAGYYRLVYHDAAYVLRQWKQHFRIIDLIPGHCNNYQDLVVMQKV